MPYAESLRAIGQSLETLRVKRFELEKQGDSYVVRSESLTPTGRWILRNNLSENVWDSPGPGQKSAESTGGDGWQRYSPLDISRLDAQQGRNYSFTQKSGADKLAQLLRTVGEHLDRREATAFHISWAADSVSIDYQMPDGLRERKDFTVEKLHQLTLHSRFRRPSRNA